MLLSSSAEGTPYTSASGLDNAPCDPLLAAAQAHPAFLEIDASVVEHRLREITDLGCYLLRTQGETLVLSTKIDEAITHTPLDELDTLPQRVQNLAAVKEFEGVKVWHTLDNIRNHANFCSLDELGTEEILRSGFEGSFLLYERPNNSIGLCFYRNESIFYFSFKVDRQGKIHFGVQQKENIDAFLNEKTFFSPKLKIAVAGLSNHDSIGEFNRLESETKSIKFTELTSEAANARGNRYSNCYPYNKNRVILESKNYINASRVKLKDGPTYICTQGPRADLSENTLDEFWEMVWQENVPVIVMVTDLFEKGTSKCAQYWPNYNTCRKFCGEISIECIHEHVRYVGSELEDEEGLTLRKFRLIKGEQVKIVYQFKFEKWRDGDAANIQLVNRLIDDINALRIMIEATDRPIVVHCSAGVGRTGTFVAEHYLCELIDNGKDHISVQQTVGDLRNPETGRYGMVQTHSQYNHIFQVLQFRYE